MLHWRLVAAGAVPGGCRLKAPTIMGAVCPEIHMNHTQTGLIKPELYREHKREQVHSLTHSFNQYLLSFYNKFYARVW